MAASDPTAHRPGPSKRGPKARLNRRIIAEAAVDVGFEELTMARVAARLGVASGALYRYVADREDLVIAAADHLYDSAPRPTAQAWRELLTAEAWARWEVLVTHPGLVPAVRATGRAVPAAVARYAHTFRSLVEAGFESGDAVLAVDSVIDLVQDGAVQAAALARRSAEGGDRWAAIRGDARDPAVLALLEELDRLDPRSFFARKLELVLDGVERLGPPGGRGHAGP